MAMMIASGFGSIVAHELGKLAMDHSPLIKQIARSAVVEVGKKSFDMILDKNPNFSDFLGHFGIHKFNQSQQNHRTFTNRGRPRRITYSH